jgi:hypothetical protein
VQFIGFSGGQKYYRRLNTALPQLPARFESIHARQNDVQKDAVANKPHYRFRSLVYLSRMPVNSRFGIKQKTSVL